MRSQLERKLELYLYMTNKKNILPYGLRVSIMKRERMFLASTEIQDKIVNCNIQLNFQGFML